MPLPVGVTPHGVYFQGRWYTHAPSPLTSRSKNFDKRVLLKVHSGQLGPMRSTARFRVIAAGRRWGKTHFSVIEMLCAATRLPKQKVWYIAPTYSMAKQIAWEKLKEMVPDDWIAIGNQNRKSVNEVELKIRLKNGSTIELKGADRPDTLRGMGVHLIVLDEFQDMKETLWAAIRPTLSDTQGKCIIIGTPKGFNHFYQCFQKGQTSRNGQWKSWQYATKDSPFIPLSEIEYARQDMDARTFRQEYESSFESMAGRVYFAFDRRENVRRSPYDPSLPSLVGQDFNIDPMCSVVLQRHGDEIWATGEQVLHSSSTEDVCRGLFDEYGWDFRHSAVIYPDPSGNHRQHARGESDIQIFREWGFKRVLFRPKQPPVRDRIMSVNRLLEDASGRRRLFIDPSCRTLISGLEQLIYVPNTAEPDKTGGHDHITDAIGYPIEFEFPIKATFTSAGYSH